jgi:hypothetical protein
MKRGKDFKGIRRTIRRIPELGLAVALALIVSAGPVLADSPWSGRHLGLGIGFGTQSVDLDRLEASVNGRPLSLGSRRVDAALATLGYREALGRVVLGAEVELQAGRRAITRHSGCVLGQACAGAGLLGRIGPILRLRATLGQEIMPGVMLSGGLGLSLADVAISHAFAQSASAQNGSAVITSARSDFRVDDLATGAHVTIGVEHRVTARAALRLDLIHERLQIENARNVFIMTATVSGPSSAMAQIAQSGPFTLDTTSVRLSLLLRF